MDECALSGSQCHSNATCNNTGGTFHCACRNGFSGNGVMCTGTKTFKDYAVLEFILEKTLTGNIFQDNFSFVICQYFFYICG